MKSKTKWYQTFNRYKYFYIMLIPIVIWYLVFAYTPMYGILIAFKDFKYNLGIMSSPWVGIAHFERVFANEGIWQVLTNTMIISFGRLLFCFPCPILLALMLNEVRFSRVKKTIQTVLYLPHFLSWVIMYGLIYNILSVDSGIVNKIIISLGGESINFLTNAEVFRPLVFITSIWKETGWETIIYLAALSAINDELYEAAKIDGAGRIKQLLYITWPELKSTVAVMLILACGGIMNAGFDQIFNLYNPAVFSTGDILDTFIYRMTLLNGEYGFGAAVGLLKSLINCSMLLIVNRIVRCLGERGIY